MALHRPTLTTLLLAPALLRTFCCLCVPTGGTAGLLPVAGLFQEGLVQANERSLDSVANGIALLCFALSSTGGRSLVCLSGVAAHRQRVSSRPLRPCATISGRCASMDMFHKQASKHAGKQASTRHTRAHTKGTAGSTPTHTRARHVDAAQAARVGASQVVCW
jgi:hypothetical protein